MRRRIMVVAVTVAALLVGGGAGYAAGHSYGHDRGKSAGYERAVRQLPSCEEDQALYPVDYEGPGEAGPGDYRCRQLDG